MRQKSDQEILLKYSVETTCATMESPSHQEESIEQYHDYHPRVKQLLKRWRIMQHTDEWYAERKLRLTASDIAGVLGLNPYSSRKKVFLKKTGRGGGFKGNKFTAHGLEQEPKAQALYEVVTGKKLVKEDVGLMVHPHYRMFGASPDGVLMYDAILLEIKCPFTRVITHSVPGHYMPQMQFQMFVTGIPVCHFVQYKPTTQWSEGVFDIVVVPYDQKWMDEALPKLLSFWKEVEDYYEDIGQPIGSVPVDWVEIKQQAKRERKERKERQDKLNKQRKVYQCHMVDYTLTGNETGNIKFFTEDNPDGNNININGALLKQPKLDLFS